MISSDWRSQIFEKKQFSSLNLGKWAKIGPKTSFFCHFLRFGSLVFLEIAYYDNLQQCITSVRGKTHENKVGGPNLGQTSQNRARN